VEGHGLCSSGAKEQQLLRPVVLEGLNITPSSMQVRIRYAEMFNVMLYVAFNLREALQHTQRKCADICTAWNGMASDLTAAKATAAAEAAAAAREREAHKQLVEESDAYKEQVQNELADAHFRCKVLPVAQNGCAKHCIQVCYCLTTGGSIVCDKGDA
jgi:hypothetical protein